MIQDNLLLILSLLFAISILTMISGKLKIAYPIFLVISGLLISLIPGIPPVSLNPDLVFLIFLPPLLYAAAWNTSWNDFWRLKRPISLLGFGLVIFTSAAVAFACQLMIPGFSLAAGFLLGGIISPPDAIAATSVLQGLKVPKRALTILEGESLVNDAASLIVFRFALAAVMTGQFHMWEATRTFFVVAGMGILIGLVIAHVVYAIHRFFPTTPAIDAAFTLITPYIMYITAEHFHVSGVLAVVSGGLFLTYRSPDLFSYDARIQVLGLWDTLVFLLNGFVFILIGLQLPGIIRGMENYSVGEAISYAIIISVVTILIRIIWVFPGAYVPRMLFKSIRAKEPDPGWRNILLIGWSGMRGVVSLASALAVPLTLANERAFPHRNLILFITFVVILFTLVLQGLSLKPVIRLLKIKGDPTEKETMQALDMRLRLANAVLAHIDERYEKEIGTNETYKRVRDRYARMIEITQQKLDAPSTKDEGTSFLPHYRQMLLELIDVRRRELNHFRHNNTFSEELIKEREWELDLEEARLRR
ncbi:Na+/H+ antiporter [Niastella vici]|uniref:Na+/H+ antiporter n=1 Tax=Niastella vici TaxID=1703345 RepID=A0A1V9G6K5_9BACT|nr:Na+/H+ antiporter [Niastella vici]OQP66279.1 Na+/H+ antiporter [Niastella vici]